MKKTGLIIILYVSTIIFILFTGHFFIDFTTQYFSDYHARFIIGFILRGVLIVLSIILLKKLNLFPFSGLNTPLKISNPTALIIPVVIIGVAIVSNKELYLAVSNLDLLLFLVTNVLVGIFEEISMRGVILPLFLKWFNLKNKAFFKSVILSSLIFGVLHYTNMYNSEHYAFDIATSQVIIAFCIGVYFCGLFFRTGNILSSMLIHAAFNIAFGTEILQEIRDGVKPPTGTEVNSFMELLPTLIIFGTIVLIGLLMVKFSDKESFIKKLKQ